MSLNLRDMSAEQHLDSFVVKQFKESRADVRIFPLGELRALFDHGHIRSEPPDRLREFKAYIAAANHYEMTWLTIEIERLDMGHRIRRGEPGKIGHRRMRTQVEEHTFADNPPSAAIVERDLNRFRSDEAAFTHDQFYSGVRGTLGVELMFRVDHFAFALLDAGHVDSEFIHFQSEFRAAPRQRGYSRGVDHVLARQACDIRARTAEPFPLDHRGAMTLIGNRPGCPFTGFSAPENENFVFFYVRHWPISLIMIM